MENQENKYHVFEIINIIFILSFIFEYFTQDKDPVRSTILMFFTGIILIVLGIYGFFSKKYKIIYLIPLLMGLLPIVYLLLVGTTAI